MTPNLEPVIIVIFGITGDLAQRKLLPALYHLLKDGLLHEDSVILGITRRDVTADQLLGQVELCVNEIDKVCDPVGIARVRGALRMHQMSLTDGAEYDELLQQINAIEDEKDLCMTRLYYLSIPPQMFEPIVRNLGQHGLNASCQHGTAASRLLVEKPFGYDTASAEALIQETGEWFTEEQLFRIDHYVAKETVQNILAFRLYNPLFTDIWNSRHIESIEVTAFEQITIEGRAIFYEGVGALRDFIQSHLLQLLTVVTMELPGGDTSDAIHAAKLALLESVTPVQPDQVAVAAVRGQYEGYREEVQNPRTATETYASVTVSIDNERWQGVPMTIRTGKAMARKLTEIRIIFRADQAAGGQHGNAQQSDDQPDTPAPNQLVFNIQPDEGISLQLNAKKPGFADALQSDVMDFNYNQAFSGEKQGGKPAAPGHPDAYERVLVDAARGDHTLFTTSQEVLAAWRIVENVLRTWSTSDDDLRMYPQGSDSLE
jgi:glucose-6-phosphate 1-dehydrogenase